MECNTGLQLALNLLKSAGVSFYNEKIYHKISIGIAVVLVGFMMILGIIEPIKNFQSYEKIPEHVEIVSNYSLFLAYVLLTRIKRSAFIDLLQFDGFWPISYIDEKTEIKQRKIYTLIKRCFMFMVLSGYSAIAATLLQPIFKKQLPLLFYNFVDFTKTPYFQIGFIWIFINSMFVFPTIVGMDGIYYSLLCFLYCQIMMLKIAVGRMNLEYNSDIEERKCFQLMKTYVEYNLKLIQYMDKANNTFSLFMFIKLCVIILNCTMPLSFIANYRIIDFATFTRSILFLAVSLWNIFMICAASTIITDHMESLADALYECNWCGKISQRLRIGMVMMIQRSQRRQVLVAGRIINVSLETFISILRYSFSLYTLLKSAVDIKNK